MLLGVEEEKQSVAPNKMSGARIQKLKVFKKKKSDSKQVQELSPFSSTPLQEVGAHSLTHRLAVTHFLYNF